MEMTKDQLIELLRSQIEQVVNTDEFSEKMKGVLQKELNNLQNDVVQPFNRNQGKHLVQSIGYAKIDGDYMTTSKGSIINLKNKSKPWVAISPELEEWVIDFAKYIRTGKETKVLSSAVDTDGGYLVPEEFRAMMVMYDAEPTVVWPRATVWPMSGQKLSFPKLAQEPDIESDNFDHFAGVSFTWTEEGGEKAETEPDFGLIELIVHELAGYTEITNVLLQDSAINIINFLTTLFRAAWYWYTDREFLRGTGGKKPLGLISDPAVLTVPRQTTSTVEVDDFLNMEAKLPAAFDSTAIWLVSKKVRATLRGQKDDNGVLVLQEFYRDFVDGYPMTILGRPAVLADGKVQVMGTAGDVVLGDFKWYYIGFREDFSMDSSTHYKFRNNRTSLRCAGRVDGQAAIPQAFCYLDDVSS